MLPFWFMEKDKLNCLIRDIKSGWISFEDDLYLNLEHPGLAEFFQFFFRDLDSLPMTGDEKNYTTLYYFYKNAYKKLPSIMAKTEKWKEVSFRDFLFELFFETWDSRIVNIPNSVNKHPEDLAELIDWEKIKEEFPLASKSNYHLLNNKTFLEDIKKKFLTEYSSKNPEFYESIKEQAKDVKDNIDLYAEFIETLTEMETSSKLIEVYVREYLLFNIFNRFYVDNEKKKNRLNQKNDKALISNDEKKEIFQKMMNEDKIEQVSNINLLSEEEKKIIDSIIQKFDKIWEKSKKKIKRYIVRLAVKKKPFKVMQFLKNNNLSELPEWVIWLLDDLMIDIVEDEILEVSNENINKNSDEIDGENETISIEALAGWINREIFEIFQKDPVSAVIQKAKQCNYSIENENLLRKQIETICLSSKFVKNSLLISLLKNTFSKPILKNSWAYSLRAWWSGYRFVLRQNSEWNFTIIWFYNHDDYEKVLDGRMW